MSIEERQQRILDLLEKHGACTYQELAELFRVSSMTVRRDVDQLSGRGEVIKTVGGVQEAKAPSYLYETELLSRISQQGPQKQTITLRALELIKAGQTIYLDGSTTCLELAKLIADNCRGVTIITNSALVCLRLCKNSENVVITIGGQCHASSMCFFGPESDDWAGKHFVDMAFMSTKGFLPGEGTFESSVETFRIKQIVAKQCGKLVLLVDYSKFGKRGLSRVLDISQIDVVITDDQTPQSDLELLTQMGKTIVVGCVEDKKLEGVANAT